VSSRLRVARAVPAARRPILARQVAHPRSPAALPVTRQRRGRRLPSPAVPQARHHLPAAPLAPPAARRPALAAALARHLAQGAPHTAATAAHLAAAAAVRPLTAAPLRTAALPTTAPRPAAARPTPPAPRTTAAPAGAPQGALQEEAAEVPGVAAQAAATSLAKRNICQSIYVATLRCGVGAPVTNMV
jgi:DnaK suppressor protein